MYTINLKSTVKFKFPYMKFKTKLSNIKAIKINMILVTAIQHIHQQSRLTGMD